MLRAYRGELSDRYPVAPEFWYYYPAKILGVSMVELEREISHWKALLCTFRKYETEGWGIAFPEFEHPDISRKIYPLQKDGQGDYHETVELRFRDTVFTEKKRYSLTEPSWVEKHLLDGPDQLEDYLDMALVPNKQYDIQSLCTAHAEVGENYLLELYLGLPFFDFIASVMGFEETLFFFKDTEENLLGQYQKRYIDYQLNFVKKFCTETPYESYNIGCMYSCLSLLGLDLWRQYDKPYLGAVADELHHHGKLLHVHFHGKSMAAAGDLAEIGLDCVCPFERGPGGDVNTIADLVYIRNALGDRVTFNGNVHTVNTLIFGTPEDAQREVVELKEAFAGSHRLIIGTGDQVGVETREEVLLAMIEEAKNQ
jgi:hypothetical protein